MWDIVGKVACLYIAVKTFLFAWSFMRQYVFPKFGFKIDLRSFGEWAVVTGATDGIGKEYARQLAKQGFKVVLISRSQEKLDKVAETIRGQTKQEVRTISFDFGNIDGYEQIADILNKLQIGVLVNNVGVSYEFPDYFHDVKLETFENMIKVNVFSAVKMTHIVLPQMKDRKKGVIINVSSASAIRPMPLLTVYSAAKAFVDYFSRALQMEYEKDGIICQSVRPFLVCTKLSGIKKASALAPLPKSYVASQLATVGIRSITSGFSTHELQQMLLTCTPSFFIDAKIMERLQKGRLRALKKKKLI